MKPTFARPLLFVSLFLFSLSDAGLAQTLTRTDGVIGSSVDYQLQGNPGDVFVFILSSHSSGGPPGTLTFGFDLPELWRSGVLDGAGTATVSYSLSPPDPSLHGTSLFAKFVTVSPGPASQRLARSRLRVSNLNSFVLGLPMQSTNTVGDMTKDVSAHTMTRLQDGRVLIAGGDTSVGGGLFDVTAELEIFDPQTQTFCAVADTMSHPRAVHSATLLMDGRVLLLGGSDGVEMIRNTADIFDPATGMVEPTEPMSVERVLHTATLLDDGRVLVTGGLKHYEQGVPVNPLDILDSSEIYLPATDDWTPGPTLPRRRMGHGASLLTSGSHSGKVLITGGIIVPLTFLPEISSDCRRYNPGTDSFENAGALNGERVFHAQLTFSVGNKVLVAGGTDVLFGDGPGLSSCELYDADTSSWSNVGSFSTPRARTSLIETGAEVIALGGLSPVNIAELGGNPLDSIERTDLAIGAWSSGGSLLLARELSSSVAIEGGLRVLTTGNVLQTSTPTRTAEIYVP